MDARLSGVREDKLRFGQRHWKTLWMTGVWEFYYFLSFSSGSSKSCTSSATLRLLVEFRLRIYYNFCGDSGTAIDFIFSAELKRTRQSCIRLVSSVQRINHLRSKWWIASFSKPQMVKERKFQGRTRTKERKQIPRRDPGEVSNRITRVRIKWRNCSFFCPSA